MTSSFFDKNKVIFRVFVFHEAVTFLIYNFDIEFFNIKRVLLRFAEYPWAFKPGDESETDKREEGKK